MVTNNMTRDLMIYMILTEMENMMLIQFVPPAGNFYYLKAIVVFVIIHSLEIQLLFSYKNLFSKGMYMSLQPLHPKLNL